MSGSKVGGCLAKNRENVPVPSSAPPAAKRWPHLRLQAGPAGAAHGPSGRTEEARSAFQLLSPPTCRRMGPTRSFHEGTRFPFRIARKDCRVSPVDPAGLATAELAPPPSSAADHLAIHKGSALSSAHGSLATTASAQSSKNRSRSSQVDQSENLASGRRTIWERQSTNRRRPSDEVLAPIRYRPRVTDHDARTEIQPGNRDTDGQIRRLAQPAR